MRLFRALSGTAITLFGMVLLRYATRNATQNLLLINHQKGDF